MRTSFKFINNKYYRNFQNSINFSFKNMILYSNMIYLTKINYVKSQLNRLTDSESIQIQNRTNSDISIISNFSFMSLLKQLLSSELSLSYNRICNALPSIRLVGRLMKLLSVELTSNIPLPKI